MKFEIEYYELIYNENGKTVTLLYDFPDAINSVCPQLIIDHFKSLKSSGVKTGIEVTFRSISKISKAQFDAARESD